VKESGIQQEFAVSSEAPELLDPQPRRLEFAGGGWCDLRPGWLEAEEASRLQEALRWQIPWQQRYVRIAGKQVAEPRLSSWHGEPEASYVYSGVRHEPLPWVPVLSELRGMLDKALGTAFNSVLANRYRDGRDAMGMHADDERELGPEPLIASISLGMTRTFVLAPKKGRPGAKVVLPLRHGTLLVMGGPLQRDWKHGIPREAHVFEERINLTFRRTSGRSPSPV
jgi:alkylated DNA repair dioxygenase AlkB